MDNTLQKEDLLEQFRLWAGCRYLSDLHTSSQSIRSKLARKLTLIHPDAYSLHTWKDACHYLTGKWAQIESTLEGKKYLLQWLTASDSKLDNLCPQ
jgi:hypothetical protein